VSGDWRKTGHWCFFSPFVLLLLFFLVFELIYVGKSSLHPLMSFLGQGLSPVSSSNLVNKLLYLMDFKYWKTDPGGQNRLRGCASFRSNALSVSETSFRWARFLTIVSPTRKGNVMNCLFLFLSNVMHQVLYCRKTSTTKYLSDKHRE
jgi:hypothetical protein